MTEVLPQELFSPDNEPRLVNSSILGPVRITFLPAANNLLEGGPTKYSAVFNDALLERIGVEAGYGTLEEGPPINVYAAGLPRNNQSSGVAWISRDKDGAIIQRNVLLPLLRNEDMPRVVDKLPQGELKLRDKLSFKRLIYKKATPLAWDILDKVVNSKLANKYAPPLTEEEMAAAIAPHRDLTEAELLTSLIDIMHPENSLSEARQQAVERVEDLTESVQDSVDSEVHGIELSVVMGLGAMALIEAAIKDPVVRIVTPIFTASILGGIAYSAVGMRERVHQAIENAYLREDALPEVKGRDLAMSRFLRCTDRLFNLDQV